MGLTQITTGGVDDNINIDNNTLKVDGTNNRVGIGTASPASKFTVADSGYSPIEIQSDRTTATDNIGGLHFKTATTNVAYIQSLVDGTLKFRNTSSLTERMRIDSSGRVGIGTTATQQILTIDVNDSGTAPGSFNGINIANTNTTANNGSAITFGQTVPGNSNARIGVIQTARGPSESQEMFFGLLGSGSYSERMRIDSSGNVGINKSSPSYKLDVDGGSNTAARFTVDDSSSGIAGSITTNGANADLEHIIYTSKASIGSSVNIPICFHTNGKANERMRIDSSGNVGIGTSSPDSLLTVDASSNPTINIKTSGTKRASLIADTGNSYALLGSFDGYPLVFSASAGGGTAERARIDTSGRLLVGTTSSIHSESAVQSVRSSDSTITIANSSTSASGEATINLAPSNNITGGQVRCAAEEDFSTSANRTARLEFNTRRDGALDRRFVITSTGSLVGGNHSTEPSVNTSTQFNALGNAGYVIGARNSASALFVGRNVNDGTLAEFRQAGTTEGTISVSGSTVSYNGAHLARWSQLASGAARTEILRGSVLSNLDEMCEWGEEDNEQLNRMKVSDVEGDVNVSGVFDMWDDDDDTYINDFYCAMTGDFVIRIAQGTTVARGDLLMSAGDGTAKPQDDDIVRSKTIAKVTSTTVSTTYSDGSYCVPCVLMAC